MALYWPKEKVALDIVDDPNRRPFEGDESYTVVRVTCAELANYDSCSKVMARLADLLGRDTPSSALWERNSRMLHALLAGDVEDGLGCSLDAYDDLDPQDGWSDEDLEALIMDEGIEDESLQSIKIIATSSEEADLMRQTADVHGQHVEGVSIWEGPVPPGSYEEVSPYTRMSTPEYFFLRKANELPFAQAVALGVELCGKFRTSVTQYRREGGYDILRNPRSTRARLREYLREVRKTREGKRARRVLRYVVDECASPMGCYLYLLLCLPRSQGGYGIGRAILSGAFEGERDFLPSASGKYLAYDLSWPDKRVALQYTGRKRPGERQLKALRSQEMQVLCATDADIADAEAFDALAHKVAVLVGHELPDPTDKWLKARSELRRLIEVPQYPHMRLIADEMIEHLVA